MLCHLKKLKNPKYCTVYEMRNKTITLVWPLFRSNVNCISSINVKVCLSFWWYVLETEVFCPLICSSVHLCTASLLGSVTCTCPCWTGCMSTTPLNSPVASFCVRTTAPMKLSSSRCEHLTKPCVKTVVVNKMDVLW